MAKETIERFPNVPESFQFKTTTRAVEKTRSEIAEIILASSGNKKRKSVMYYIHKTIKPV